jgi:hypothetical protein
MRPGPQSQPAWEGSDVSEPNHDDSELPPASPEPDTPANADAETDTDIDMVTGTIVGAVTSTLVPTDADPDAVTETETETDAETHPAPGPVGRRLPEGYVPPPSPAYAAQPPSPVRRNARAAAAPQGPPAPPVATSTPSGRRRQAWQLLTVGVALVVVAATATLVSKVTGGDDAGYAFGDISAVTGSAQVRAGDADAEARPLEEGETVLAGWVVEAPADAAATLSLTDGGTMRVEGGARVAFVDLAVDPDTGERAGRPEPAIRLDDGRAWVNPGGSRAPDATAIQVQIPDGIVASTGNPMALDCTGPCTVEAPAGGVELTTESGVEMAPAANEVVTFQPPDTFDLTVGDAPSEWARQNLDADVDAGVPEPEADDAPGIRASAVVDGTYSVALEVVGAPTGDALPGALQYAQGETYTLDLDADGSVCVPRSCSAPVTAVDGASGTARVADGTIALTLGQPIDCYDEAYTTVVVPGIGATTVEATLETGEVEHDGERWLVRTFAGSGTVAVTLTTRCNPDDVVGTSASAITIAGG